MEHRIFWEGGYSLVSFLWGGGETVCFRDTGWLFGAARGLEALDLGAEMWCGHFVI